MAERTDSEGEESEGAMDKITLVTVLTDYKETYDIRDVDKPEKESEE